MSQLTDQMPFQPWTSKYQPINAYWMARFSKIAYAKKTDGLPDVNAIKSELGAIDPKFTDVSGFDAQSSQGVVIKNEEYVVAAFRGTDEIADWLDNLNAVAEDGPLGNVQQRVRAIGEV